ncbi:hypothetical protein Tco_0153872 [Tanacetum coccineum]
MEKTRFVGKSDAARVKLSDGRPLKSILKMPKGSSQVKNMGVGVTVDYVTCNQPCGSKLDSNVSSRSRSNDTTKSVSIVGTSEAKRKLLGMLMVLMKGRGVHVLTLNSKLGGDDGLSPGGFDVVLVMLNQKGSDDVRHAKGGQGINAVGSDEGNEDFASGNGTTAGGNGGKDKMDNEANIVSGSSDATDHTVTIVVGGSKKTYIASTHPIGPDANGLQYVQDKAMPYNATDVHAHGCRSNRVVMADVYPTRPVSFENVLALMVCTISLAFPVVQNYTGMEQVLEWGPWMIHNTPLILKKWTLNLPLTKDKVTKVPVWVNMHKVPLVAYSEDGLSLIASHIGKPLMMDAFTYSMCEESWGRIGFAHALVEICSDSELKREVIMVVHNEDGIGYTKEVIKVEHEWQPLRCADCKIFVHPNDMCPKIVRKPETLVPPMENQCDGFTKVSKRKNNGKKVDNNQHKTRPVSGVWFTNPKLSFYHPVTKYATNKRGAVSNDTSTSNSFEILNNVDVGDNCRVFSSMGTREEEQDVRHATDNMYKSSKWDEDFESVDEVDEVLFPKFDKFGDQFNIRLKGRVRK